MEHYYTEIHSLVKYSDYTFTEVMGMIPYELDLFSVMVVKDELEKQKQQAEQQKQARR